MSNAFTIPKSSSIGRQLEIEAQKRRQNPKAARPIVLPNSSKYPPLKTMEKK